MRADLLETGYTTERLAEVLGPLASAALHRDQVLPVRRALAATSAPVSALVRLLVLGEEVPVADVAAAVPRTGVAGLLDLGLAVTDVEGAAETAGALLRGTCDLRPYGDDQHDWWLASDLSELALGEPLPTDHVLGVGGASTTLASWTPRPRVARALDLGTGCGVQAVHLSTHADRVVATDLSERALGYARFTALLNGIDLDLRGGSLLEPVAGERFDLVVSNPPFVITPRSPDVPLYEYRDGGAPGDAIVAGLVRDLGSVLAAGGIAQLLGNWELREDETWTDHVGAWLEGTGLDAWVIQREDQDVAEYAETWARDGGHRPGSAGFEDLYAAWLDDFAARGIERVGFGVITLQQPTTERDPFRYLEDLRGPVEQPAGPAILAGLRARTWLAEHTEAELLGTPWSVAPDVTEERVGRPGQPDPMVIQLRQGGGLRRPVRLDTVGAGLVGASDGELTPAQIVRGIAVLTEQSADDLEAQVVPTLRTLVADGLLQ
nr:methyltransferase [Ornithinimicrobium sp. F0845]